MGRHKVLERLVGATSGMEASQLSFAVSALESLAMKQQEAARAGKILEQATAQPADIRSTADIPEALEEAVRLKLGMLLADPAQVDFKAIKDIKQAMDYLAQLRPKDETDTPQNKGLTLESANAIRKQILGIK
jgi:hypothetical protein